MTRDERLDRLERRQDFLLRQIAEANLRLRFVMETFKLSRPKHGCLVDPTTQQPQMESKTLYEAYLDGGRARTIDLIEREAEMQQAAQRGIGNGKDLSATGEGTGDPAAPHAARHPADAAPLVLVES